jgi:hypothetical protein
LHAILFLILALRNDSAFFVFPWTDKNIRTVDIAVDDFSPGLALAKIFVSLVENGQGVDE